MTDFENTPTHPAANPATEALIEEYGDRVISFGERTGTVREALEACPHLLQYDHIALRGIIQALLADESQQN